MSEGIYIDAHATTPVDPRVVEKMSLYFTQEYGNAASIDHVYGNNAQAAVKNSRKVIAEIIGARRDSEIIFTSGATESNNLALIGAYRYYKNKGNHIICSAIEHPCVLESLKYLEKYEGAKVTILEVDEFGLVDPAMFEAAITPQTIIVSVMYANNEIGTIQPITQIGEIAKKHKIIFHCDAAQALGHEKINVEKLKVDLLSFSGHKFYGPKGVGGLYVRSFAPMVRLQPIIHGGGQERGFRSGTANVPGIVGMTEALKIAQAEQKEEKEYLKKIRDSLFFELKKDFPDIKLNGHPEFRLTHNLNVTIPGVESKALMQMLKGKLSFSAGSACSTVKVKPSHVLLAIGRNEQETFQSIRLGLCRKKLDSTRICNLLVGAISSLKG
jgi:cysteine desulfurase